MINLSKVMSDPRISQSFSIFRKSGKYVNGRFIQEEKEIQMHGVIGIASPKDIEAIPEGDRVGGEMLIHTTSEIFVTRKDSNTSKAGTSDELLWRGERYKIYSVSPYADYGFYKAIAMRKESS